MFSADKLECTSDSISRSFSESMFMMVIPRKRRSGSARRHNAPADYDDVQYGCHVTSTATSGSGKRVLGGVGAYCDCAAATEWPPQQQDVIHRTNLMWQTLQGADENAAATIYCRHAGSGPTSALKTTPDLFVDARPEVTSSTSSNMAAVKPSTHLYESPVFSHLDRLLH